MQKIEASNIVNRLNLSKQQYFLFSFHREESVDSPENLKKIFEILNSLAEKYHEPIIVTTHPRTRKRMESLKLLANPLVQFMKPFGFFDYVNLQINAHCVISDSGTITEESSILNFPALNLREMHERPEGFEEGSVMFVGFNFDRLIQGLNILEDQPRGLDRKINLVRDYSSTNVSEKVLRIIHSYTDYVNHVVWKKS
jgi:UDP-N-acetylglucosamine 2-epimerase (non-hydrolysing)